MESGSLLAKWMIHHGKENPMYVLFDEISAIDALETLAFSPPCDR